MLGVLEEGQISSLRQLLRDNAVIRSFSGGLLKRFVLLQDKKDAYKGALTETDRCSSCCIINVISTPRGFIASTSVLSGPHLSLDKHHHKQNCITSSIIIYS